MGCTGRYNSDLWENVVLLAGYGRKLVVYICLYRVDFRTAFKYVLM